MSLNYGMEYGLEQGHRESLRGSGKIYVVTALIEYLTVILQYIDLLGPTNRVEPRAKCPSCPPLGDPGME